MKSIRKILKIFSFGIISIAILTLKNSSITFETRSTNTNVNKNNNLNAMAKVINNFALSDIYSVLDTYYGKLTGYVADCPLCSGYLACNNQNVLDRTTTYQDQTYGTVRIVASSRNLPCGSIVRFTNPIDNQPVMAIVLDRGVTGTSLDLLVESTQTAITRVGNKHINYDILRFGWTKKQL